VTFRKYTKRAEKKYLVYGNLCSKHCVLVNFVMERLDEKYS
jgi:hypothetical protein